MSRSLIIKPALTGRLFLFPIKYHLRKAIISRRRTYAPWWLLGGQLASVLLRWPWEADLSRTLKQKEKQKR